MLTFALVAVLASLALALEPVRDLTGPYPVDRVIDGDTIAVVIDGKVETIRLIGIDTPETVDPRSAVQPYGPEASRLASELLSRRDVWLERDVELRDRYDRLLAYVYVDDPRGMWEGQDRTYAQANLQIAMAGYADQLTVPPNVQYAALYQVAVRTARMNAVGMWADASGGGNTAAAAERSGPAGTTSGDTISSSTTPADPPPATSASGGGAVQIACIFFDPDTDQDFGAEYVTLEATSEVDVRGWRLHDAAGHSFALPDATLSPGETLRVANHDNAVWNNGGDTATLLDASGHVVDTFTYNGRGQRACR